MSLHQKLQYRALHHMYGMSGNKIAESMLAADPALAEKVKMRNVCALIPNDLFDRLEGTCAFLDLSKREFIQAAIEEALDLADKVMDETGVNAHYDAMAEDQAAQRAQA